MSRTALLGSSALVALCLCANTGVIAQPSSFLQRTPVPGKIKLLYSQNSNYSGEGVNSMNFSSGTAYNDQAADDFVIPKGKTWRITEVDVSGVFYNGYGPADSENVIFYRDAAGIPGNAIARGTFSNLQGSGTGGDYAIALPNGGVRLKAGHYWVSVVANMYYVESGEWAWYMNDVQHKNLAVWRNPGGGWDLCGTWCTLESMGIRGPDLMFTLKGVSRSP